MNTIFLYNFSGLALFAIGLHGLIRSSHLLRKILAANLMSSGVFLVMIVGAYGTDNGMIDPVPHAMVLTGIVVSVGRGACSGLSRSGNNQPGPAVAKKKKRAGGADGCLMQHSGLYALSSCRFFLPSSVL
jgi:multicomponent Na+:H+ antiporter subunit C